MGLDRQSARFNGNAIAENQTVEFLALRKWKRNHFGATVNAWRKTPRLCMQGAIFRLVG